MKSTENELKNRGYIEKEELEKYKDIPTKTLVLWLNDENPVKRTIGATYLNAIEEENSQRLIKRLKIEKCLYTKLAICESLQKGKSITASLMVKELGKIGHNQYHELPTRSSSKKSYPLPRDIIARTLAKMETTILPILLKIVSSKDEDKISEVLDAIGFMVFYHPELANEENVKAIYQIFNDYSSNSLLIWKALTCLSAFPLPNTYQILEKYSKETTVLGAEARRSLQLISK